MINNKINAHSLSDRAKKQLNAAAQQRYDNITACRAAARLRGRAVIFSALLIFVFAFGLSTNAYGAGQNKFNFSRTNLLRTSYNPEHYSLFQIDGDTIYARGKYTDDRIKKIFIPHYEDRITSYKMSIESDGSYEAEIVCSTSMDFESIGVQLTSGAVMTYIMYHDEGWFFPDNGLSEKNRQVFDSITDASPESVGYYMSETADAHEISVVQEQIKLISDSVVDGIEGDYEKARALCRYVADHFYYDCDARDTSVTEANVALTNILKTSRTICIGFADLYCALLQAQGIDAVNIVGGSVDDLSYENLTDGVQNHEFTAFFYEEENRWVWVDSCWCGSGDYKNGEYVDKITHEKYFDISDEALALNHRADYAQRRNFFTAKASEKDLTSKTDTEAPEVTTSAVTTVKEEAQSTSVSAEITEEQTKEAAQKEDDTVLYIIAAVLGIAVLIVLMVLIKTTRKKP